MNTDALVELAEAFAAHRGLTMSTVSTYAANDGKFFGSMKDGGASCTFRRAAKVLQFFSDNWPSDLEWPKGIERPSTKRRAA